MTDPKTETTKERDAQLLAEAWDDIHTLRKRLRSIEAKARLVHGPEPRRKPEPTDMNALLRSRDKPKEDEE